VQSAPGAMGLNAEEAKRAMAIACADLVQAPQRAMRCEPIPWRLEAFSRLHVHGSGCICRYHQLSVLHGSAQLPCLKGESEGERAERRLLQRAQKLDPDAPGGLPRTSFCSLCPRTGAFAVSAHVQTPASPLRSLMPRGRCHARLGAASGHRARAGPGGQGVCGLVRVRSNPNNTPVSQIVATGVAQSGCTLAELCERTERSVLGLEAADKLPSKAALKKAYRKRVLQCHPDKCPDVPQPAEEAFKLVTRAMEVLESGGDVTAAFLSAHHERHAAAAAATAAAAAAQESRRSDPPPAHTPAAAAAAGVSPLPPSPRPLRCVGV
jgi:hypothetical protein